ncbi:MAG: cell division protein FtsZ [Sphingomonadaceae bacterium]
MSINIGPPASDEKRPRITVIGVGGAGGNAIANMIDAQIEGVDFIVANTDAQALNISSAERRIQLGPDITGGLGAGARPEVGKAAAEETVSEIEEALEGVNMCFIAAGMGGGTGTGAAPVIAEAARRKGVLTVGVVTKPFLFEGTRRMRAADAGIDELQQHVDTLIVIPNKNMFLFAKAETTFKEAFELEDDVLQQGVRSITDLMVMPGLINLDFADVRSVMSEMGKAMMGTGEGEGENRALEAAERAIANPLLDGVSMQGAKGVIISIIGGEDMKLLEVDEAANHIRELVDDDANIIWGSAFNPDLDGRIRVSVVATGIENDGVADSVSNQRMSLSGGRAPKRPVLDSPEEDITATGDEDVSLTLTEQAKPEEDSAETGASSLAGLHNRTEEADPWGEDEQAYSPPPASPAPDKAEADKDELVSRLSASATDESDWGDTESDSGKPDAKAPLNLSSDDEDAASPGELLLGGGEMAGDEPASEDTQPPASGRRRGLVTGEDSSGSENTTLFERMASLSRGPARSQDDDEEDEDDEENGNGGRSINIPRFLNRQNNQ